MKNGRVVDKDGNIFWYQNDRPHRENGPAIEYADGSKSWYQNGLFHRVDGPAMEWANGDQEWYQNDDLHREDGPAVEWVNGYKEWWLNNKRVEEKLFQLYRFLRTVSEPEAVKAKILLDEYLSERE